MREKGKSKNNQKKKENSQSKDLSSQSKNSKKMKRINPFSILTLRIKITKIESL